MTAALRGRRKVEERRERSSLLQAYHVAAFGAAAMNGTLKPFREYVSDPTSQARTKTAQAIAFFHRMRASGVPVEISRTVN